MIKAGVPEPFRQARTKPEITIDQVFTDTTSRIVRNQGDAQRAGAG